MADPRRRPGSPDRSVLASWRWTAVLSVILLGASSACSAGDPTSAKAVPQAASVSANSAVGALFTDATAAIHECTGTVLSAGHGRVLTAAHCLSGTGAGMRFVPGYDGTAADAAPFGVWTVGKVWAAAGWLGRRDPTHDFAILKVGDQPYFGRPTSIDEVTGGHPVLVSGATGATVNNVRGAPVGPVTVVAYNAGAGDAPVSCATGGDVDPVPSSFRCGGYFGGSSGAPWLQKGAVKQPSPLVGIIGGPQQGGCTDSVSYSPTFDDELVQLMARAEADLPGDDVPDAGAEGC